MLMDETDISFYLEEYTAWQAVVLSICISEAISKLEPSWESSVYLNWQETDKMAYKENV